MQSVQRTNSPLLPRFRVTWRVFVSLCGSSAWRWNHRQAHATLCREEFVEVLFYCPFSKAVPLALIGMVHSMASILGGGGQTKQKKTNVLARYDQPQIERHTITAAHIRNQVCAKPQRYFNQTEFKLGCVCPGTIIPVSCVSTAEAAGND